MAHTMLNTNVRQKNDKIAASTPALPSCAQKLSRLTLRRVPGNTLPLYPCSEPREWSPCFCLPCHTPLACHSSAKCNFVSLEKEGFSGAEPQVVLFPLEAQSFDSVVGAVISALHRYPSIATPVYLHVGVRCGRSAHKGRKISELSSFHSHCPSTDTLFSAFHTRAAPPLSSHFEIIAHVSLVLYGTVPAHGDENEAKLWKRQGHNHFCRQLLPTGMTARKLESLFSTMRTKLAPTPTMYIKPGSSMRAPATCRLTRCLLPPACSAHCHLLPSP